MTSSNQAVAEKLREAAEISAAHEPGHLEEAVAAFVQVGRAHKVL